MLAPKEMPGRADFCHGAVDHPLFVLQEILAVPPPCDSSPAELSRALSLVAGGAQYFEKKQSQRLEVCHNLLRRIPGSIRC